MWSSGSSSQIKLFDPILHLDIEASPLFDLIFSPSSLFIAQNSQYNNLQIGSGLFSSHTSTVYIIQKNILLVSFPMCDIYILALDLLAHTGCKLGMCRYVCIFLADSVPQSLKCSSLQYSDIKVLYEDNV